MLLTENYDDKLILHILQSWLVDSISQFDLFMIPLCVCGMCSIFKFVESTQKLSVFHEINASH